MTRKRLTGHETLVNGRHQPKSSVEANFCRIRENSGVKSERVGRKLEREEKRDEERQKELNGRKRSGQPKRRKTVSCGLPVVQLLVKFKSTVMHHIPRGAFRFHM